MVLFLLVVVLYLLCTSAYQHILDAICTFSFVESLVMKCVNALYETRCSNHVVLFVPKQHPVKDNLFANILFGPAYPGQFASRISIIGTFIFI